jgi:hypothetical protein
MANRSIASLINRLEQIRNHPTDSRRSLADCFTGKLFNRRIGYQWQTVRLLHWQIVQRAHWLPMANRSIASLINRLEQITQSSNRFTPFIGGLLH